jgi:hypothetical protein
MGDIADAMINGDMDYITGEWLGDGDGYPRTNEELERSPEYKAWEKKCKEIRKEIHQTIQELIANGVKRNVALNEARKLANQKHGKDWRNEPLEN